VKADIQVGRRKEPSATSSLRSVGRLLIAHALRLIVVLCVGLSIVFSILTVVGLALADVAHPWYIAAVAVGAVAVLLSVARLVHLTRLTGLRSRDGREPCHCRETSTGCLLVEQVPLFTPGSATARSLY
jgi:hypothetical protein